MSVIREVLLRRAARQPDLDGENDTVNRGGKEVWGSPDSPRLRGSLSLPQTIKPDRETVKEILARAIVFREQAEGFIRQGKSLRLLALPGVDGVGCISCGGSLQDRRYRCEVCELAVKLALKETL